MSACAAVARVGEGLHAHELEHVMKHSARTASICVVPNRARRIQQRTSESITAPTDSLDAARLPLSTLYSFVTDANGDGGSTLNIMDVDSISHQLKHHFLAKKHCSV